jgi:hypothetical protein
MYNYFNINKCAVLEKVGWRKPTPSLVGRVVVG